MYVDRGASPSTTARTESGSLPSKGVGIRVEAEQKTGLAWKTRNDEGFAEDLYPLGRGSSPPMVFATTARERSSTPGTALLSRG
jgi:hypothetical protein